MKSASFPVADAQALFRIAQARAILPDRVGITVDGGISPELLPRVVEAGADTVVLGRAIWGAADPGERYRKLAALEIKKCGPPVRGMGLVNRPVFAGALGCNGECDAFIGFCPCVPPAGEQMDFFMLRGSTGKYQPAGTQF